MWESASRSFFSPAQRSDTGKSVTVTRGPYLVRTYKPSDQAAVERLYYEGLLTGKVDPNDTGIDLDHICDVYFSLPENHFWIAEDHGHAAGMVGVVHDDGVALIRRLRVDPHWRHTHVAANLIEAAINHCRRHGSLKIAMDTHIDRDLAVQLLDHHGFQFTRSRVFHGKDLLEFYLNLYEQRSGDREHPVPDYVPCEMRQTG